MLLCCTSQPIISCDQIQNPSPGTKFARVHNGCRKLTWELNNVLKPFIGSPKPKHEEDITIV